MGVVVGIADDVGKEEIDGRGVIVGLADEVG